MGSPASGVHRWRQVGSHGGAREAGGPGAAGYRHGPRLGLWFLPAVVGLLSILVIGFPGTTAGASSVDPAGSDPSSVNVTDGPPSSVTRANPDESTALDGDSFGPDDTGARICSEGKIRSMKAAMARLLTRAPGTEPTPEQRAYDALYYDIDLRLEPASRTVTASVLSRVRVTDGPLDTLVLDLDDRLDVSAVHAAGVPAGFVHEQHLLRCGLDRPYQTGETVEVRVDYAGVPDTLIMVFQKVRDLDHIWTLSEPFGARGWWPCKDYPEDKADSVRMAVTVPAGLLVASNGALRDSTTQGGLTTFVWHESFPITTYLVSLAIYPYSFYTDWYVPEPEVSAGVDSMPLHFYNFPFARASWEPVQSQVKSMLAAFAELFGPYPFLTEKYGHAQFTWGGGMEHQTLSSMGSNNELVVAHEASHQWWGDMVTCRDFHHIWMQEGMATYAEALWQEAKSGPQGLHSRMRAAEYFGGGTVYVPELSGWDRIFDGNLSYNKGGWVYHMLRHVVGDEGFVETLRIFRERHAYDAATTEDLRAAAEAASGQDLGPFFEQWIYGEGYPIYSYDWSAVPRPAGSDNVAARVALRQLQAEPPFRMPVDILIRTAGGDSLFTVQNWSRDTLYTFVLEAAPTSVVIDPDRWILRQVLDPVQDPPMDLPLLLVNSSQWYPVELMRDLRRAYEESAFTGPFAFDFWDYRNEPDEGYPDALPDPIGHGPVPAETLGRYRAVIWVAGQLSSGAWDQTTALHSYLRSGGSLLLLTSQPGDQLTDPFRDYLGIEDVSSPTTLSGVESVVDGLPDLIWSGFVSVSAVTLRPDSPSTVLYRLSDAPESAIGVAGRPEVQESTEPGWLVLLSGRPDRWDYGVTQSIVTWFMSTYVNQSPAWGDVPRILAGRPNPFGRSTMVRFYLPSPGRGDLAIFDAAGRRLRELREGISPAGWNGVVWDGRDERGHAVPSGVYFGRLQTDNGQKTTRLVRLR